jgi:hypothetical protein
MEELGDLLKKSMAAIGQAKKQSLSMNRSMTSPNLLNSLKKPKVSSLLITQKLANPMDIAGKYLRNS